ncbi:hypothetical protein C7H81_11790 [Bacillus subtilis]|nr:hypothetical protein CVV77_09525 [Bacillus sp. SN1]PSI05245.1 hypothetical protein C7H81_11790 [Bacillus subtilis]
MRKVGSTDNVQAAFIYIKNFGLKLSLSIIRLSFFFEYTGCINAAPFSARKEKFFLNSLTNSQDKCTF